MNYAVVVVGRDGRPFFLVDDEGEPALYSPAKAARPYGCRANGYALVAEVVEACSRAVKSLRTLAKNTVTERIPKVQAYTNAIEVIRAVAGADYAARDRLPEPWEVEAHQGLWCLIHPGSDEPDITRLMVHEGIVVCACLLGESDAAPARTIRSRPVLGFDGDFFAAPWPTRKRANFVPAPHFYNLQPGVRSG